IPRFRAPALPAPLSWGRLRRGPSRPPPTKMRTYILKRLVQIVPTVLMITFVVFVMMRSVPGDPVVSVLGDAYTEEDAIKAREAYGLNRPIVIQYGIWLGKLVQGDWGASILTGRPVLQDVLIRLPVTLELIVLSMAVALAIAVHAAIIGALRQNTWADYTATSVAMIGVGVPARYLPDHGLRVEPLGQHAARPHARLRAGGGAGRHPDAPPPREHAGGHPHRVRHHRARQGPCRAARHIQARAEERLDPHRDRDGAPGRLPHRRRHRGGDALRHAGPGHLRDRRHHRARLPAGAGLRPADGTRLRRHEFPRGPDLYLPGSPDPVRLRRPWPTVATCSRRSRRRSAEGAWARPTSRWPPELPGGRAPSPRNRRSCRGCAGSGAARPRWWARASSSSCWSWRSSRTCWRPRARSPATRPTPSSVRAGTIPWGPISSDAT